MKQAWAEPLSKLIFLIGPGGVGKTTVGRELADLLGCKFTDLDQEFCDRIENIGAFIDGKGYLAYVERNSTLLNDLLQEIDQETSNQGHVVALSSGFLSSDSPDIILRDNVERVFNNGLAVLLLPSKDIDEGARIVVQRHLARNRGHTREKSDAVYRRRYREYLEFESAKIFSNRSPREVAVEIREIFESANDGAFGSGSSPNY